MRSRLRKKPAPRPVRDNGYEIRPCRPEPQEDPARNQAEAERDAQLDLLQNSSGHPAFRGREITAKASPGRA
jgi:hypothetical protein